MSENVELFTTRMRKATRKVHSLSDTLVNAKFAISLRDETVWGGGLFVFYHIFGFLEDAGERLNMPDFNKLFVHKSLFRKKAFEEDLRHYLGDEWKSIPKAMELDEYLRHLEGLEGEKPELLLAYVYHLYLGLLSGGQILAKKRKMFDKNITPRYIDKVTDFTGIDISQLKKDFRAAMNEIAEKMSPDEQNAFIVESNQVFVMNNLIVSSVEGQNQVVRTYLYKTTVFVLFVFGIILAYKLNK